MITANKVKRAVLGVAIGLGAVLGAAARQVIEIKPVAGDMTPVVRAALRGATDPDVKLRFAAGTYRFLPDYAAEKFCFITNNGNGLKRIIFPLVGFNAVEIEGNGAEFIFHGQVLPFLFERCGTVTAKNLTIDWDIPFLFQGEVVACNPAEGWRDLKPATEGFSWRLAKDRLLFPGVDGFNYASLGSTLAFDPKLQRVAHGAWDLDSDPRWVEKRPGGLLRFHESLKHYPPVGTVLCSKGEREQDRYAPAIHVKSSKDIRFENNTIETFDSRIVWADRVDGLTVAGNRIKQTQDAPPLYPKAPQFEFTNCREVRLLDNTYEGAAPKPVVADAATRTTLRVEGNKGF